MSHVFATALLLSLSVGSAGLLTALSQPVQPPLPSRGVSADAPGGTLAQSQRQVDLPSLAPQQELSNAIATDVCLSLPNWQRPSELAQTKQLETMARYGVALHSDPLAEMAKTWWSHEVFSFTTYGLSARTDPLYLSGVWTAIDDTWDCYSGDQPEQINRGELAEIWLLHHRFVGLEWQDDQYVATVEPVESGLQLVQFARRESSQSLPLSIITTTGQVLAVLPGDW